MELILDGTEIKEQDDFEEIKEFHLHSAVRHKKQNESKRIFRRRIRKLMKDENKKDPDWMSPKEARRNERQETRDMIKNQLIIQDKNHIEYDYQEEPK